MRLLVAVTVAATLLVAACSSERTDDDEVTVVATTTILGDVARNVAGDRAVVEVLIPVGVDPHDFIPSSQQVAMIARADLVVANGLGLEEALLDVLHAAAGDGVTILEVAPQLDPIPFADGDALDPHVWMDPLRMKTAALAIAEALFLIEQDDAFHAAAEAYNADLDEAHRRIEELLGPIPDDRRKLVTNHDSLGYLADRYGFTVIGTVIPGGSSLGDPSSAHLAELVATINREQVPAIFADTARPTALAEAVAAEAATEVAVVELYTGSLGEPGSGADTLIGMLLLDARRIAEALS